MNAYELRLKIEEMIYEMEEALYEANTMEECDRLTTLIDVYVGVVDALKDVEEIDGNLLIFEN